MSDKNIISMRDLESQKKELKIKRRLTGGLPKNPASLEEALTPVLRNAISLMLGADIRKTRERARRYVERNQNHWQAKGAIFRNWRESLGLTVSQVARALGISPARVTRFENGEPVRDARLLESAYSMLLAGVGGERHGEAEREKPLR